jgi:hypothetical protein
MVTSMAPLLGGSMLYKVRLLPAVSCSVTFTYLKLSECWMMLSMAARTAPLPEGSKLYKVRLLLGVRLSVTFTYLKAV